jgi:hypothetical protein
VSGKTLLEHNGKMTAEREGERVFFLSKGSLRREAGLMKKMHMEMG